MLKSALSASPVIPLINVDDPTVAVEASRALRDSGMTLIEVVLRKEAALDCLAAIKEEVSGVTVGAGTVLTPEQVDAALSAGAQFIVSPGLIGPVVERSRHLEIEILPGVATPSEVQCAWNRGLRAVKFFPAGLVGGVPMLKALSSVFSEMSFVPTGGVSAANLADYLSVPNVVACGGSWLTPASAMAPFNREKITELAEHAMQIAKNTLD